MSDQPESAPLKRYTPTGARYDQETLARILVAPSEKHEGEKGIVQTETVDGATIKHIVDEASEHITDAKSVFEILPDTKLAMDILTSSIMSPNDLIGNELLFRTGTGESVEEVVGSLTEVVKDYFTNKIDLVGMCVPALEDMLFKTGSYPVVCIPHSSIDDIINKGTVSVEALSEHFSTDTMEIKNVGFLAKPKVTGGEEVNWSLESMAGQLVQQTDPINVFNADAGLVTLIDNPHVLKKPMLMERIAEERREALMGLINVKRTTLNTRVSTESADERAGLVSIYKKRKYAKTPIMELIAKEALGEFEPIWFKPPSESVIPINVPGDVTRKVGYFIALDESGNPISASSSKRHWERLKLNSVNNNEEFVSDLQRIREQMFGESQNRDIKTVKQLHRAYSTHVENSIRESVRNGVHGENAEVEINDDVVTMMLSRSLARQKTQLLYVPKELMIYMAFDFNDIGIGRSLLENTKILSSMRAMLLLANNQASMRNSQPGVRLQIELDPKDKDPAGTIEKVLTLHDQANNGRYPLGNLDLTDIANSVNRNNVEVAVSNHPAYPQTKITSEDISRGVVKVDQEMEESLRKRQLQGWGLTPELLDASSGTDFAANIIVSNKLMVKRIAVYQMLFVNLLTEVVKMFIYQSPYINEEFNRVLDEAKVKAEEREQVLLDFLETIEVALPAPDSSKIDTQIEDFNAYDDFIEEALNAYFSELMVDGVVDGEIANAIPAARAAIKGHLMRSYLRNNNVLPEIEDLVLDDEAMKDAFDNHSEHLMGIINMVAKMMHKGRAEGRDIDRKEDEAIAKEEEELNEDTDTYGDGLTDDSTGGDDTTGGEDDFSFDDETEETDEGSTVPVGDGDTDADTSTVPGDETEGGTGGGDDLSLDDDLGI